MEKLISKIALLLSLLLISLAGFAKDLKIEEDAVFKVILSEFANPGGNISLYQESENYRLDLTLLDIIDKVSLTLKKDEFSQYQNELNSIIEKGTVHFYDWFLKVKEIAEQDDLFQQELDKKLYIQLYSKTGFALLPEYKFIDLQKLKDIGLLSKIKKYNNIMSHPEGTGIIDAMGLIPLESFVTDKMTVTKMGEISKKEVKRIKKTYLKLYVDILDRQYRAENTDTNKYSALKFTQTKDQFVKASTIQSRDGSNGITYKYGLKVFNTIQSVPHKNELQAYIYHSLKEEGVEVPKRQGHIILTPLLIERNWNIIKDSLQEYTINQMVNLDDDEYLLLVRKWIKRNYNQIQTDISKYNLDNDTSLSFIVKKANRKPRRVEVLKQYDVIEKLYPNRPWMRKNNPDLIDRKGRAKYYGESFGKGLGRKIKNLFKSLIKVENYTSLIIGTGVMFATGGNASLSLSIRSLVKKSVYTLKHDLEWKQFLLEAPAEFLTSFLLGSGFSPGRLYKILAMGAGQGALQSYLTGQDVKTGAFVGAGINFVSTYLLPYSISKPMVKGFDSKALRTNRWLEITATTVKNSLQGAAVAALTGENPLKGALKGGIYGAVSAQLAIWILGTRYHPFKDFDDAEIDDMIASENAFQNDVGRGEYLINRQMILDANYRVNGLLPKMISASITLPGSVSMSDNGFTRLTTLTHEAHHLMQQHQSGVFGFYLFRYIPTGLRTGYDGHPDENFLRNFLGMY